MKKEKYLGNILYTAVLAGCFLAWSLVDIFAPAYVLAEPGPLVVIAAVLAALTLAGIISAEAKLHCADCLILAALTSLLLPFAAGFTGRRYFFLAGAGIVAYSVFSMLFDGMKRRIDGPLAKIMAGFICFLACQCFKGLV